MLVESVVGYLEGSVGRKCGRIFGEKVLVESVVGWFEGKCW